MPPRGGIRRQRAEASPRAWFFLASREFCRGHRYILKSTFMILYNENLYHILPYTSTVDGVPGRERVYVFFGRDRAAARA